MTAFHVHDEEGKILQSNKVFAPDGYGDRLRDLGYNRFVEMKSERIAEPELQYVWNGELTERPEMPIEVGSLEIPAGSSTEIALFSGILPGTQMNVATGGMNVWTMPVPGSYVEFAPPVPALYVVTFSKWPYRDFTRVVKAT